MVIYMLLHTLDNLEKHRPMVKSVHLGLFSLCMRIEIHIRYRMHSLCEQNNDSPVPSWPTLSLFLSLSHSLYIERYYFYYYYIYLMMMFVFKLDLPDIKMCSKDFKLAS